MSVRFLVVVGLLLPAVGRAQSTAAPAADTDLSLLTGLVVAALSSDPSLEVIASEDMRKQVELEAGRQLAGCSEEMSSCLADVAGALGARLVVYGKVGRLGESVVLNLSLFDSVDGKAAGRAAVRKKSIDLVASGVTPTVRGLVAAFRKDVPVDPAAKTKVLVLDIEGHLSEEQAPPPPPAQNALLFPGIGVASLGGLLAVGGGALLVVSGLTHNQAIDPKTIQKNLPGLYDLRDQTGWSGTALVATGALAVGGGLLLVTVGGE